MDVKQHADISQSLEKIVNLLKSILVALWAIFGLLLFRRL
jgi:hypothetical protein